MIDECQCGLWLHSMFAYSQNVPFGDCRKLHSFLALTGKSQDKDCETLKLLKKILQKNIKRAIMGQHTGSSIRESSAVAVCQGFAIIASAHKLSLLLW